MSPTQPSSSSNTPSGSAWRNCTSCAVASAEDRKPSTCVLLYKPPLGETATSRLSVLRETEDGFRIAEEDLKLRGEGELLGTRQSGTPGFQIARIEHHSDLLEIARDDARLLLSRDPDLQSERGQAIRVCSICSDGTRLCGCCAPAERYLRSQDWRA